LATSALLLYPGGLVSGSFGLNDRGGSSLPPRPVRFALTRLGVWRSCRLRARTTTPPTRRVLPSVIRRQVGLGRPGCVVDQEHPDWSGDTLNVQAVYTEARAAITSRTGSADFSMFGCSGTPASTKASALLPYLTGVREGTGISHGFQDLGYARVPHSQLGSVLEQPHYGAYAQSKLAPARHGTRPGAYEGTWCGFLLYHQPATRNFNIGPDRLYTAGRQVKEPDVLGDVTYTNLDQNFWYGCVARYGCPTVAKPGAGVRVQGPDTVILLLRAQRNW